MSTEFDSDNFLEGKRIKIFKSSLAQITKVFGKQRIFNPDNRRKAATLIISDY